MAGSLIINGKIIAAIVRNPTSKIEELVPAVWKECPNCKYHIYNGDVSSEWPGLPVGVKFDPTDEELLVHLEEKVGRAESHVLIDDFIPTIEKVEGICYTHPKNLPGMKMDGSSSHFFHRISNAYDVGHRKRRRISNSNDTDSAEQIRWHKTGKSLRILDNGVTKGWKKILVLYKCKKGKRQKTNWMIHQCHLGVEEDEKNGELVVSRVFWQARSNNTGKSRVHAADAESSSSAVKMDPTTPNMCPPQPCRLSGSPFETEQNQVEEEPGSPAVQNQVEEEPGSPAVQNQVEEEPGSPAVQNQVEEEPGSPTVQNQDEEEPGSSAVQLNAEAEVLAGTSQSVDYGDLPDLDQYPLHSGAIHENPVPLDYPVMHAFPELSDLGDDTFTLTASLNDWLNGNAA